MYQPFKNLAFILEANKKNYQEDARRSKVVKEINRFFSELNNNRPYSESTIGIVKNLKEVRKHISIGFINL